MTTDLALLERECKASDLQWPDGRDERKGKRGRILEVDLGDATANVSNRVDWVPIRALLGFENFQAGCMTNPEIWDRSGEYRNKDPWGEAIRSKKVGVFTRRTVGPRGSWPQHTFYIHVMSNLRGRLLRCAGDSFENAAGMRSKGRDASDTDKNNGSATGMSSTSPFQGPVKHPCSKG